MSRSFSPSHSEVVLEDGTVLKKIPGYINAYASTKGEVLVLNSKGVFIKPISVNWKTTKGSYIYVKIISDELLVVSKAEHRLICLAYHGDSDLEVNHINGDKHDNRPVNLEWINRKDNVQHAYDTGLCSQGYRVSVKEENETEKTFYSLSSLSRYLKIPRHLLKNHINKGYIDIEKRRIYLTKQEDKESEIKRHQRKPLIAKCYKEDKIYIFEDMETASLKVNVKPGTINFYLKTKPNTPMNGFVFKTIDDKSLFPVLDEEKINSSFRFNLDSLGQRKKTEVHY